LLEAITHPTLFKKINIIHMQTDKTQAQQFDFLKMFIEQILDNNGFGELSEETRKQFVPMFAAEAERRLGLALLPLLTDAQAKELEALMKNSSRTPQMVEKFWKSSVPNFENTVKETLDKFALEFKKTLQKI